MKTISNNKKGFPEPFRILIYLLTVVITGFMNWMVINASDPGKQGASRMDTIPAEAPSPAAAP